MRPAASGHYRVVMDIEAMELESRIRLVLSVSWLDDDSPERSDTAVAYIVAMRPEVQVLDDLSTALRQQTSSALEHLSRPVDDSDFMVTAQMGAKIGAEADLDRKLAVIDRVRAVLKNIRDRDLDSLIGGH